MAEIDDLYQPVPESRSGVLFSRRIGSLRIIFWSVAVLMFATIAALLLLWVNAGSSFFEEHGLGQSLVGPAVALFGVGFAALLKLYDLSEERLGAIDTFLHEMIGISRLIYTTNLVGAFRSLYFLPGVAAFADIKKSEVYTISYDNNIKDLGFLGSNELNYVVSFYTMIKGARDEIENFKLWPVLDARGSNFPPGFIEDRKHWDIISVMYCLFVAFESAYYAVENLADNEQQKRRYEQFIMAQMCDCYVFLLDTMPEWDRRIKWLTNKRRTEKLFHQGNEIYKKSQDDYQGVKRFLGTTYPHHYREHEFLAATRASAQTPTDPTPSPSPTKD